MSPAHSPRKRKPEARVRQYLLELSESQAELVCRAVELYARLGLGQFQRLDRFFSWAPKETALERARPLLDALATIKNGNPHSNPGIYSKEISDDYRVLFDLYQVIRYRLAWDREPNPKSLLDVDYREPLRKSASEELARISRIEKRKTATSHRKPEGTKRS